MYSCGCVNELDLRWGVMHNTIKCPYHVEYKAKHPPGHAYYESLGVLSEAGVVLPASYLTQFTESFGELKTATTEGAYALEIGCGVSPYVNLIRSAGYTYIGVDEDPWAANYTHNEYGVHTIAGVFPDCCDTGDGKLELVLMAHVLEHVKDAPKALLRVRALLKPGGWLYIIVPDDEDQTNPDHLWFFNEASLRHVLAQVGFEVHRFSTARLNDRENFMYLLARKPL